MKKSKLRRKWLSKRLSLSKNEHMRACKQICDLFMSKFNVCKFRYIHTFLSMKEKAEFDTSMLMDRIATVKSNVCFVVPKVVQKDMKCFVLKQDGRFVKNKFGVMEPLNDAHEFVDISKIDMVVVPLIICDQQGHRVGYGGGYYDRFLAQLPKTCRKVGVGFFTPINKISDIHDADVPLNYYVSPYKIVQF